MFVSFGALHSIRLKKSSLDSGNTKRNIVIITVPMHHLNSSIYNIYLQFSYTLFSKLVLRFNIRVIKIVIGDTELPVSKSARTRHQKGKMKIHDFGFFFEFQLYFDEELSDERPSCELKVLLDVTS
ncbi:hypothetical protein RIR_jg36292.t1 [Rhizophagus irregularis DAOM 181602=DAOM 197198]|nr:hypothetical protein RIR_jg36292.t1 [Rhizophagus irregularis DAOM 181602=DAOM 197198]CAB4489304.1 unnamed protein product [Rhizophagus irregularis]